MAYQDIFICFQILKWMDLQIHFEKFLFLLGYQQIQNLEANRRALLGQNVEEEMPTDEKDERLIRDHPYSLAQALPGQAVFIKSPDTFEFKEEEGSNLGDLNAFRKKNPGLNVSKSAHSRQNLQAMSAVRQQNQLAKSAHSQQNLPDEAQSEERDKEILPSVNTQLRKALQASSLKNPKQVPETVVIAHKSLSTPQRKMRIEVIQRNPIQYVTVPGKDGKNVMKYILKYSTLNEKVAIYKVVHSSQMKPNEAKRRETTEKPTNQTSTLTKERREDRGKHLGMKDGSSDKQRGRPKKKSSQKTLPGSNQTLSDPNIQSVLQDLLIQTAVHKQSTGNTPLVSSLPEDMRPAAQYFGNPGDLLAPLAMVDENTPLWSPDSTTGQHNRFVKVEASTGRSPVFESSPIEIEDSPIAETSTGNTPVTNQSNVPENICKALWKSVPDTASTTDDNSNQLLSSSHLINGASPYYKGGELLDSNQVIAEGGQDGFTNADVMTGSTIRHQDKAQDSTG